MTRTCTVCRHPDRRTIDQAMVRRTPFRTIAQQYGVSAWAALRHHDDHLPAALSKAQEAAEVAQADDLLSQVRNLQARAHGILDKAEAAGDLRTALSAIREARGNLELLAKLLGELDERPQVNVLVSTEWLELRAVIVGALEPHPEARGAVLRALEGAGNGRA